MFVLIALIAKKKKYDKKIEFYQYEIELQNSLQCYNVMIKIISYKYYVHMTSKIISN